ncbi:MAG: hypothetical protein ACXVAI_03695 [Candidatus Limnocylindrales bacterium]
MSRSSPRPRGLDVQFQGEIPQPMTGEVWIDPICLYGIDGQGWFAVGPVLLPNGAIATPAPVPEPPTKSLPALTP